MKQLSKSFADLVIALGILAIVALISGIPARWVSVATFMVLDLAGIMWASNNHSKHGGHRVRPKRQMHLVLAPNLSLTGT